MAKLCQICTQREAKIHFTEIKDGKQTEMHICEVCASEKNMTLAFPSLLGHIVKGGGPDAPLPGAAPTDAGGKDRESVPSACPNCGLTYADFKARGRLGCGTCYEVFAPVLVPLLEKVHGEATHTGSAPDRAGGRVRLERMLTELEEQLDRAIDSEDYERAASLRDRLHHVKQELNA